MNKLHGKTAVVTGSGRGIALKLAEAGAQVVVNDLDPGAGSDSSSRSSM